MYSWIKKRTTRRKVLTGRSNASSKTSPHNSAEDAQRDTGDDVNDISIDLQSHQIHPGHNKASTSTPRSKTFTPKNRFWKIFGKKSNRENTFHEDVGKPSKEEAKLAERYLNSYLHETFGRSASKTLDIVSTNTIVRRYNISERILTKDEKGDGLYVILEGGVNVLTSDGELVIAVLGKGSIFGDISVMFDVSCTANVDTTEDTTVLKIGTDAAVGLLKDHLGTMDVIDLCIRRRYLPVSDLLDSGRAYRRTGLVFLKRLALFNDWPDMAVKELILSFEHTIVLLYGAKSMMVVERDPASCLYVVIRGKVEIVHSNKTVAVFDINCDSKPFVFGIDCILFDNITATMSVKALENCQVIRVQKEWIRHVLSQHPELGTSFKNKGVHLIHTYQRWGHLRKQYETCLQVDILCQYLGSCHLYKSATGSDKLAKVLDAVLQECPAASSVLLDVEKGIYEAVLVVCGEVVETSTPAIQDVADDHSTQTRHDKIYATGDVCKIEKSASYQANSISVVLKIRNNSRDQMEELITEYSPLDFI